MGKFRIMEKTTTSKTSIKSGVSIYLFSMLIGTNVSCLILGFTILELHGSLPKYDNIAFLNKSCAIIFGEFWKQSILSKWYGALKIHAIDVANAHGV